MTGRRTTSIASPQQGHGFDRLLGYIGDNLGFETGFYHDGYLDRRIRSRMRRTSCETYDEYLQILKSEPNESDQLLDALSITVTHFFRNPTMWGAIRPLLRTLTSNRPEISIWSAPCADGREPYSLALLALDDGKIDADRIRILGTDINDDALAHARNGVYRTTRTTDIESELAPLSRIEPLVKRNDDRFRVCDAAKGLVSFETHDLIRDDPPETFDLVLCRNLLIYIDNSYKQPIFETLSRSIGSKGYLVIGMTETIPRSCRNAFEPYDKKHRIFRIK